MGWLSNLFGGGKQHIEEYLSNGAIVVDVRTPSEFQGGHVSGAKNFPLDTIQSKAQQLKSMNKPVIVCCASGMRSGQAASILKNAGVDCINGGSWTKVAAFA